jgi:hypothetical protein
VNSLALGRAKRRLEDGIILPDGVDVWGPLFGGGLPFSHQHILGLHFGVGDTKFALRCHMQATPRKTVGGGWNFGATMGCWRADDRG